MSRPRLIGYASSWDTLTHWGKGERHYLVNPRDPEGADYYRRMQRGALDAVVQRGDTVPLVIDHDPNRVITRCRASLDWGVDATGIWFAATVPDTAIGREALDLVQNRGYSCCSVRYEIGQEDLTRENGRPVYIIRRLARLVDLCISNAGRNPRANVRLVDY